MLEKICNRSSSLLQRPAVTCSCDGNAAAGDDQMCTRRGQSKRLLLTLTSCTMDVIYFEATNSKFVGFASLRTMAGPGPPGKPKDPMGCSRMEMSDFCISAANFSARLVCFIVGINFKKVV
jgi:hypothetical protein